MGKVLADPTVPSGEYAFTLSLSIQTADGAVEESFDFKVQVFDQNLITFKNPEEFKEDDTLPPFFIIKEVNSVGTVVISFSEDLIVPTNIT